jgi:cell division GTPase FtsZ
LVAITVFSMGGGGGAAVKERTRKKSEKIKFFQFEDI